MPRWSDLRRSLVAAWAPRSPTHSQAAPSLVVPLSLRGLTRDGADIRVLLEVTLSAETVERWPELERIAHALVVPAVSRWLLHQELAALPHRLLGAREHFESTVQAELEALGSRLLRIDVVAVEHLLASPSAPARPEGGAE